MNTTIKISKEQLHQMERAARRDAEIQMQMPRVHHSVHKSKKDYNRSQNKKLAKVWNFD